MDAPTFGDPPTPHESWGAVDELGLATEDTDTVELGICEELTIDELMIEELETGTEAPGKSQSLAYHIDPLEERMSDLPTVGAVVP